MRTVFNFPPGSSSRVRFGAGADNPVAAVERTECMMVGIQDASRTGIAPVFDVLQGRTDDWVRALLLLNRGGSQSAVDLEELDLKFDKGYWGKTEHSLDPPVALLSWLIRHPTPQLLAPPVVPERTLLAEGEPAVVARALRALRTSAAPKGWHLLEGPSVPDVMIETADALIVIECTSPAPNGTPNSAVLRRHPMWRHIDAAWEIRGRRRVFGFFIVPGQQPDGGVPPVVEAAFREALSEAVLEANFPHRSAKEQDAITACFLGGTSWNLVCKAFNISLASLPRAIRDLPA
jgi:hypothetical protein